MLCYTSTIGCKGETICETWTGSFSHDNVDLSVNGVVCEKSYRSNSDCPTHDCSSQVPGAYSVDLCTGEGVVGVLAGWWEREYGSTSASVGSCGALASGTGSGLVTGALIGIVVAAVAVVGIAIAVSVFCIRRRKGPEGKASDKPPKYPNHAVPSVPPLAFISSWAVTRAVTSFSLDKQNDLDLTHYMIASACSWIFSTLFGGRTDMKNEGMIITSCDC